MNNYTANLSWAEQEIIDTFFESLQWTEIGKDPTVDIINYGSLMTLVNFEKRWIYKGSLTTPPCSTLTYWNVLGTVYPIK